MKTIYEVLDELGIEYEEHKHQAVFTVEEAEKEYKNLPGARCKNLFLRNKKGNKHYLVIAERHKQVDLKKIGEVFGEKHISFASPERLKKYLNLTPGSVTPFGLINDTEKQVIVGIDKDLLEQEYINFHPNKNTATLTVSIEDFKKFLKWTGSKQVLF